jgi:hypothetical protein
MHKTKWFLPAFSVALGLVMGAAFWAGGNGGSALFAVALMSTVGLAILLGGRSELVRGLRGDGRDEYWARLDLLATALAGIVLITVVIGMCVWEWAHGRSGSPYTQLGAIAGVAYIAALGVLRWRS